MLLALSYIPHSTIPNENNPGLVRALLTSEHPKAMLDTEALKEGSPQSRLPTYPLYTMYKLRANA